MQVQVLQEWEIPGGNPFCVRKGKKLESILRVNSGSFMYVLTAVAEAIKKAETTVVRCMFRREFLPE